MNEVQGFILEGSGVRGAVVRLEETWRQVIAEHKYAPEVRALLGEGIAATVLLASGIKAKPSVSLQLQGEGPLKLLVIQCADGSRVRGMAHCSSEPQALPLLGAGMLLQILPGREEERAVDAFESAVASAATVTPAELTGLAAEELLPKLFAGSEIRLFKAHAVTHDCRCTPERLAGVVRMLGEEELKSLLAEQGHVELTCEFCNRTFRYDEQATQAI